MPEDFGFTEKEDTPLEKFQKYRKENPKEKDARKEMKESGSISTQSTSREVAWQELLSHKQNVREDFSKEEHKIYYSKMKKLRLIWQLRLREEKNA